jgi:hypothetical protein
MDAGRAEVGEDVILKLSGRGNETGTISLANISQDEREAAARKGWALPDGSYPCRNAKELHAAAVLAASKHGDWRAAQALIRWRARELGVDVNTLPGFGQKVAASAETMKLALAMAGVEDTADGTVELSGGAESPSGVIARHPELAHLFKAARTSRRKHPSRSGKPLGTKDRAHSSDLDEDPGDEDQPAKGGEVHREVRRYLKMRESEHGGESPKSG